MRVLMIGPKRDVGGGVATVVNQLYDVGLDKDITLKYLYTMKKSNPFMKGLIAILAIVKCLVIIPRYDIIHIHMSYGTSFYRKSIIILISKMYNKKVLIHMHGSEFKEFYFDRSNQKQKKYISNILNKCDVMLALSEEWKETLSLIMDKNKVRILYNGVKMPCNYKENYDGKNIIFLGALGKRKGIFDLIQAMSILVKKYPYLHLYIGGDGAMEEVRTMIERYQLSASVEVLGWISGKKKTEYIMKSSLFILPSYNEGMPMAILEAMSYGLPVISTYVGGIPKVIDHMDNGILIKPGDINALQNAIELIIGDHKTNQQFGQRARLKVENEFNLEKNKSKLIDLYECTLNLCSSREVLM